MARLRSSCNASYVRHTNRAKARFVQDVLCEFCRPAKLVQAEMQLCHSNKDSNRLHENLEQRQKRKRL